MAHRIILLIGIPGSGKTTLAIKLKTKGFKVLNADSIRAQLYGDEANQGNPQEVFDIFFNYLDYELKLGQDLIIDNTNLNKKHRTPIISKARMANYQDIQLWYLDVPLEICLTRNSLRTRKVNEEIITNMHKELNLHGKPHISEGKVMILKPDKTTDNWLFFPQH